MPDHFQKLTHDIRGKVTSILLAASLIHEGKAGPVTSQQTEISGLIISEAETLHEMLLSMLAIVSTA